jgi:hypothetical protein
MPAKSRLNVVVTDGAFTVKGFIELKKVPVDLGTNYKYSEKIDNSIVLVKEHVVLTNVGVSFENFEVLGFYKGNIGEPVDYFQNNGEVISEKTFPINPNLFTPHLKENSNGTNNVITQKSLAKEEAPKNVNVVNSKPPQVSNQKQHI